MKVSRLFNFAQRCPSPVQEADATVIEKKDGDDVRLSGVETPSSAELQSGVKEVEAITTVWTQKSLILAYVLIFLVFFINSYQEQTSNNLVAYVTSAFSGHSLVSVTSIVSGIVGGILRLPIAKLINIWGRNEGFAVMTGFMTLGLIMMAACKNVETYCAAQVFYWVGYDGFYYVLDVFMADTSALKSRAIVFAFSTTPYIATTFAGPSTAERLYNGAGWRWGYGIFAIVTPIVALPLITLFVVHRRAAKKQGLIVHESSGRSFWENVKYYFVEFDVIGLLLLSAGFTLFLLPFSLESYQAKGWQAPMIIAMLVIGIACLILFTVYARFWSPKPFIPFELLLDRTVFGGCALSGVLYISFYCWDSYFTSYLQLVNHLSIADAGYVANIYSIGSCFWAVVVGVLIHVTGRFKWLAMYFGIPVMILGSGLMIAWRQPSNPIGLVVLCQILIAFSGGTLVICEQMAVMAASDHNNIATVLAIQALFTSVGGSIGSTISSAIWTHTVPGALREYLPAGKKDLADSIYESLTTALSYPVGSPVRTATEKAYGRAQKYMCTAGTCTLVLAAICVVLWRDIRVKDMKQVKGVVA